MSQIKSPQPHLRRRAPSLTRFCRPCAIALKMGQPGRCTSKRRHSPSCKNLDTKQNTTSGDRGQARNPSSPQLARMGEGAEIRDPIIALELYHSSPSPLGGATNKVTGSTIQGFNCGVLLSANTTLRLYFWLGLYRKDSVPCWWHLGIIIRKVGTATRVLGFC
jgi:hypothetical protein